MSINIQVTKGKMKNNEFMVGAMTWAAVANQVMGPENKKWDNIFGGPGYEQAQRQLNRARVRDSLVPYLTQNDDSFFSSLTLCMIPMDGSELTEGRDYTFEPCKEGSNVGELKLGDHIMLFPADGQHRRAAIELAIDEAPSLAMEEVPVVLTRYTAKGGVRQLFSDLNLNAKPVSKTTGYNFEQRLPIVLATKCAIQKASLLEGRVNLTSNSLSARSSDVVTLNTLVVANTEILSAIHGTRPRTTDLNDAPLMKPIASKGVTDPEVLKIAEPLIDFWEVFTQSVPGWNDLIAGKVTAGALRDGDDTGTKKGYVSAYGIGWQAAALVYAALLRSGLSIVDATTKAKECFAATDWSKGPHWNAIAMVGTRVNNTGPGVRATAGYILNARGISSDGTSSNNMIKSLLDAFKASQSI
jgi:DGQHR domain-containing protein